MVAHLGLRTHELLYEVISVILLPKFHPEKAECFEGLANLSHRISTLIQNSNIWVFFYIIQVENGQLQTIHDRN